MFYDGKIYNVIEFEIGVSIVIILCVKCLFYYGNDMYDVVFLRMMKLE